MAKTKRVRGINCNAAAASGIKLVLITRFEELYSFHEAALNWSDPEGRALNARCFPPVAQCGA